MTLIGYSRVSTTDQHPDAQAARLREHGCEYVFTDHGVSGRQASRPQWDACRAFLRRGDALVVTKLDRIGAPLPMIVNIAWLFLGRRCIRSPTPRSAIAEAAIESHRTRSGRGRYLWLS